jgi:hypothetical protein
MATNRPCLSKLPCGWFAIVVGDTAATENNMAGLVAA